MLILIIRRHRQVAGLAGACCCLLTTLSHLALLFLSHFFFLLDLTGGRKTCQWRRVERRRKLWTAGILSFNDVPRRFQDVCV